MKRLLTLIFALTLGLVVYGTVSAAGKADGHATTGGNMSANPKVLIETTKGNITVELDAKAAPKTVENILAYVKEGFYNGTIFHRVIPGFMVQGGGMTADMREKADKRPPIKNEANNGLKNDRGTLAMARTNDPHSASSQFFINVNNNDFLNFRSETPQGWGYAVFGKVTEGMDVVDAIVAVKTGNHGPHSDVPAEPVIMTKVSVVE
jgi:cyclophilin family peptidyl-prolyl cis-trans isomerase